MKKITKLLLVVGLFAYILTPDFSVNRDIIYDLEYILTEAFLNGIEWIKDSEYVRSIQELKDDILLELE